MKVKKASLITWALIICSMMIASLFIFERGRLFLYTQLAINGPQDKAIWAVNKIASYKNSNEALKECLISRSWVVRENAASSLCNTARNDEDLADRLCQLITYELDDSVKIEFIILLSNNMVINDNVVALMRREIGSSDERIRFSIISNIKCYSDFSSNNPELKQQFLFYSKQLHEIITYAINNDKSPKFQNLILEYLSTSIIPPEPEHLDFLINQISTRSENWIRSMAVNAISKISKETSENHQIISKLNSKLVESDDSSIREDIMNAVILLSRGE